MRTFGVEEELLLVDVDTGVPVALADLIARPESGDGDPAGDKASRSSRPGPGQPSRRLARPRSPLVSLTSPR